jgi:hypothetical protein
MHGAALLQCKLKYYYLCERALMAGYASLTYTALLHQLPQHTARRGGCILLSMCKRGYASYTVYL